MARLTAADMATLKHEAIKRYELSHHEEDPPEWDPLMDAATRNAGVGAPTDAQRAEVITHVAEHIGLRAAAIEELEAAADEYEAAEAAMDKARARVDAAMGEARMRWLRPTEIANLARMSTARVQQTLAANGITAVAPPIQGARSSRNRGGRRTRTGGK